MGMLEAEKSSTAPLGGTPVSLVQQQLMTNVEASRAKVPKMKGLIVSAQHQSDSVLHMDVDREWRYKTILELLAEFLTPRDRRLLATLTEDEMREHLTILTCQVAAAWGVEAQRQEEVKGKKEKGMEQLAAAKGILERERLKDKLEKEEEDHKAQVRLLTEEKEKRKEMEAELEQAKKEANDLHAGLVAEQSENMQLKAMIRAGRASRYLFPKVQLLPEELIPIPKFAKWPPLEIKKDLSIAVDDDIDARSD
ncbi:hypothetical protein Dimus_031613 [Dionaea muscipula]